MTRSSADHSSRSDSTKRFSNRVANYVRYRPGYPPELLGLLQRKCALNRDSAIADIGSGTGKLSELFLTNGNPVFAAEPNAEMRTAGEELLAHFPRFRSQDGTAEATGLASASVDFVTAGQAFHWFNREQTRGEFQRILKPDGWVILIWNDRQSAATPFALEYERVVLKYSLDYKTVSHRQIDLASLQQFFHGEPRVGTFDYSQRFDFNGVKGRLLSSSYAPEKGQLGHEEMLADLERTFDAHQRDGFVTFDYKTLVYYAKPTR